MDKKKLPQKLNRTTIYESQWINLYTDKVLMPSGKVIEKYHVLDYPNQSVGILLTNEKNELCFIQSLRYTTQKVQWELPAGGIDKGEEILDAAKREVYEETGYMAEKLELLYTFNPSNGMSNQVMHIVTAQISDKPQKKFDTDEVFTIEWFSYADVQELVKKNDVHDGVSLVAVLFYLLQNKK